RGAHASSGFPGRDHHRHEHLVHRRRQRGAAARRGPRAEERPHHDFRRGRGEERGRCAGGESDGHGKSKIEGEVAQKRRYSIWRTQPGRQVMTPTRLSPSGSSKPRGSLAWTKVERLSRKSCVAWRSGSRNVETTKTISGD